MISAGSVAAGVRMSRERFDDNGGNDSQGLKAFDSVLIDATWEVVMQGFDGCGNDSKTGD